MAKSLQQWLDWQETLHPQEIDLGLQRVEQVIRRLLPQCYCSAAEQFPFTIITIAGTNGKGSTVAILESILVSAGYHVGSYTSPHILHYNERIKINQQPVSEQLLCASFGRIDKARADISLSYFEFSTLAAIDIIYQHKCDVAILEVGLGGRLDAVNVVDADIALVTTVDIDHQQWLGNDRDTIGLEKAGIYRVHKPALYGDSNLPQSIRNRVTELKLDFWQYSVDYHYQLDKKTQAANEQVIQWHWQLNNKHSQFQAHHALSAPGLSGDIQYKNASNALMVLELLNKQFPVNRAQINQGLKNVQLKGRFQRVNHQPDIIVDVAHNKQAAKILRQNCEQQLQGVKVNVIVGMLNDKDVSEVIAILAPVVKSWRVIDLATPRAMPAQEIAAIIHARIQPESAEDIRCFSHFEQAFDDYSQLTSADVNVETLLVFGSFFTVSAALQLLEKN